MAHQITLNSPVTNAFAPPCKLPSHIVDHFRLSGGWWAAGKKETKPSASTCQAKIRKGGG